MKAVGVLSSSGKSRNIVAGVELLAKAMDSVIMRVQVMLSNSSVRLEHLPDLKQRGIA